MDEILPELTCCEGVTLSAGCMKMAAPAGVPQVHRGGRVPGNRSATDRSWLSVK
jgi:hypothetical protein